jgi:hypothetical protein
VLRGRYSCLWLRFSLDALLQCLAGTLKRVFPEGPGVSDPRTTFSYPYAVEHEGKLYIGCMHKDDGVNELAVVPIEQLRIER